eukprot:519155-Alexandrium_andersonii.AAC.1
MTQRQKPLNPLLRRTVSPELDCRSGAICPAWHEQHVMHRCGGLGLSIEYSPFAAVSVQVRNTRPRCFDTFCAGWCVLGSWLLELRSLRLSSGQG